MSYKDSKPLTDDLKAVYTTVNEPSALDVLDSFAEKWDAKYPKISKSWRENWAGLSTYFKYPQEVRRLIYTTDTIESFNRQLRSYKIQTRFPHGRQLLKTLYLAMKDIAKKWTSRCQDWSIIHAQLSVYFAGRMPD
ncbi:transposase [Synergistes jonesii]|uniref:transposase n=1 Tax=Synergistes jonesii TaxID=2754 RepID=UPI00248EBF27|nr:transposase [Synergistes jonesii]